MPRQIVHFNAYEDELIPLLEGSRVHSSEKCNISAEMLQIVQLGNPRTDKHTYLIEIENRKYIQ